MFSRFYGGEGIFPLFFVNDPFYKSFFLRSYCYCGEAPGIDREDETKCNSRCGGNNEDFCGGNIYVNYYKPYTASLSVFGTGL